MTVNMFTALNLTSFTGQMALYHINDDLISFSGIRNIIAHNYHLQDYVLAGMFVSCLCCCLGEVINRFY